MSNWLKKFLDKLAKANDQAFSSQKMDCCELNRQRNQPAAVKEIKK